MDQTTLDFFKQAFEQLTKEVQDYTTEIKESFKSCRNEIKDNCRRMMDNTKRLENTRNEVESKELEDHERNQNNQEVSKMMEAIPDRKKERLQMTGARRLKLEEYRAFQKFLKNVCSVEIWLNKKLHIAADESYREPHNLESEIQKHSSFEAEVMDSDERVQSVINEGEQLLHSNHYAKDEIVIRLEEIKEDWKRLLELKQIKREKLNEAYQALLFRRSVEEFEVWLGEVEIQVSNDFGNDLASDNNILRCHPALENDYQHRLEKYESINEIDGEVQWFSDRKSLAASLDLDISLTVVQSLQKKYRTLEVELNSREHIVKSLMDRAVNMMRSGHEFSNDISVKVKELENRFVMVKDMASLKMLRLQDALESEKFYEESSEAEAWIDDKLSALATSEVGRDEISIQMLQGELSIITAEVEAYQETIDKLSQRCSNLVKREHYDADNIKKREEEIVQEYKKLRQLVAQSEVSLSEAFQYFGFLQECTKLQEWIKDQMTNSKIEKHGVDVEHAELLIHAFDTFYASLMNSEARLQSCLISGNALIEAKCRYSAKIQEKMIGVQTQWKDLLELVNGLNELLVGAKQVHMFDRRAEEIISWISEKEVDLCYDTISQDPESNQDLLRKPQTFEDELEVIEDKANFREQEAKKLVEEFPETNEHIDSKREDTLEAYKYLVVCAERKKYNLQQLEPSRGYFNQEIAEKLKILKLGLGTWKKRKDICDQNLDVQLFKKEVSVFVNWLITRDDALKEEKLEDLIGRYCDFEERFKVQEKTVRCYFCEQGNCRNGESCRFSHCAGYVQGLNILGRGQCNEFASPTPLPLSRRYRKHRELDRKIKTLLERDASGI
ncbi:spectrin alpha chain, non-erythrocytic 1-like [Harmonia axyridis]|uniref:spectrin alpha chain, non-erythrocytic 1-like n=1 Tax=Harmonia axyridis TaxID=115357 RepID=UPI001E275E33|nr:spectrin alpha chain, non-erythrocytic 1-like [Harmonia axyridis]